jgi:YD repeat-containing protein
VEGHLHSRSASRLVVAVVDHVRGGGGRLEQARRLGGAAGRRVVLGEGRNDTTQAITYAGTNGTVAAGLPDQATTVTGSNPTTGTATSVLGYQDSSQVPAANAGNLMSRSTAASGPIISGIRTTSGGALCLTDPSASTTDGTQQTITGCGGTGQTYAIGTDGTVKIAGKCLDAAAASPIIRTPVVINTCSAASTTQKWKATASGTLVNTVSGLCLADPSSNQTPGTKEWLWTCGATGEVFTTPTNSAVPAAGQTQTFTYDAEGRTASAATGDGTHTNTSTYLYDADGNLLEQTSAVDGTDSTRILYLFGGAEQITLNVADRRDSSRWSVRRRGRGRATLLRSEGRPSSLRRGRALSQFEPVG